MEKDSLSPSLLSLGLPPSSRPGLWEQWALQFRLCGALMLSAPLFKPVSLRERWLCPQSWPHERGGSEACAPALDSGTGEQVSKTSCPCPVTLRLGSRTPSHWSPHFTSCEAVTLAKKGFLLKGQKRFTIPGDCPQQTAQLWGAVRSRHSPLCWNFSNPPQQVFSSSLALPMAGMTTPPPLFKVLQGPH